MCIRDRFIGHQNLDWPGFNPMRPLKGVLDEAEIFNRALSQAEIQSLYLAGSAGQCKLRVGDTVRLDGTPVSYTQLDVYKRQVLRCRRRTETKHQRWGRCICDVRAKGGGSALAVSVGHPDSGARRSFRGRRAVRGNGQRNFFVSSQSARSTHQWDELDNREYSVQHLSLIHI